MPADSHLKDKTPQHSIRRFFIEPGQIRESSAILAGPEVHHLKNVLRLQPGDHIELMDGTGNTFLCVIESLDKDEIQTRILAKNREESPAIRLVIGQALLTGKKMDLIVQKATELGVHTLQPFRADHCSRQDIKIHKEERWDRIILEACKQCGRPVPMFCPQLTGFEELLRLGEASQIKLIFWEKEEHQTLQTIFHSPAGEPPALPCQVLALIGPEGGFSPTEIEKAKIAGFIPVTLGKRILRAETATIAVMAILQFLLGNLARNP